MNSDTMSEAQQVMLNEVIDGLSEPQKRLPSKYFYDEKGSELFDEITRLEEYYPTRTEKKILEDHIDEISQKLGRKVLLIEPGSGNSYKTRLLLDNLKQQAGYVPMDISEEYLYKTADQLQEDYPNLAIIPLEADYTRPFELPAFPAYCRKVAFFPGSTIGNFELEKAQRFLKTIHDIVEEGGALLIGVDLIKNREILEAAYDDEDGVTAEFNLNMLLHLNREIGADFDISGFEHKAFFSEEKERIEMHLVSTKQQVVTVNGHHFEFMEGESIHTENSHKYSLHSFAKLVEPWFEVDKVWTDENEYFSVQYLVPK